MKTIANLSGPDFLRAVNRSRHAAEKLLKVTGIPAIRKQMPKNMPELSGKETPEKAKEILEERRKLIREQTKKNMNDILDALLEKNPEETCAFLRGMCILEEGEAEPDGMELLLTAMSLLSDNRVIDFFTQLVRSGLFRMDA